MQIQERDPIAERLAERVAREERAGRRFRARDDVQARSRAVLAEDPLDVERCAQAAPPRRRVAQRELEDLDGLRGRHEDAETRVDAVTRVLVRAVALAVRDGVELAASGRQRRRRPEAPALLVAQIDRFARRIADRIVPPGREPVVVAVLGPREAGREVGRHEAEPRMGDDVDPGRRRHHARVRVNPDRVLAAPIGRNPPKPLNSSQAGACFWTPALRRRVVRPGLELLFRQWFERHLRAAELLMERAVGAIHHRACCRAKQQLILGRDQISAAQEHATGPIDPRQLGPALDEPLDGVLQILPVAGAVRRSARRGRTSGPCPGGTRGLSAGRRGAEDGCRPRSSASTIGRSPEMPYFHSAGCPRLFTCTASGARSRGSLYSSRPPKRWKRSVSSSESPRWRSSICACVLASAIARATARRSWYFSMR